MAIVASGPSAKAAGVEQLKGRLKVVAIKKTIELVPFADAVYGCDAAWWDHVGGLPDFKGLKLCYAERAIDKHKLQKVRIDVRHDRILTDEFGLIGSGGNSGFQAMNLVAQWGVNRILLIGIDLEDRSGVHWYGRNNWSNGNNPGESNFRRWADAFNAAAPEMEALGVDVVNASPSRMLKAYRRQSVAETLTEWGL